ncbi:MAG: NUDIX domain-containing protein [Nocardioidaceae bacterium]|nr:NUDIX domain-containing protein [Marmoricola sp.]
MRSHLQYQRVAAYAVIIRDDQILLSRLAPSIASRELWTLPGGGIDFGEDPADAVVREVREETSLDAIVGRPIHIGSAQRVIDENVDMHSVRIVYAASVASDSPPPKVVEVDGSTVDARWHDLRDVHEHRVPLVEWARPAIDAQGELS